MSDEDDFDELPSITVSSNSNRSSCFSMPSAERVAAERARDEACERELRLTDSSGSEGEAALAAAVAAAALRPAPHAPRPAPAAPPPLLRALLPHLPAPAPAEGHFLAAYLDALQDADDATARALTDELNEIITGMVAEAAGAGASWSRDEVLQAGAWLCGLAPAGGGGGGGRAVLRALHLLLEDVASDDQTEALCCALCAAALCPRTALELSDALRGGGGPRALRCAAALAAATLARLAGLTRLPHERSVAVLAGALGGAWRALPAPRRYLALQLLARLLPAPGEGGGAGGGGEEGAGLLEALAQAPPGSRSRRHSPDMLKVLAAAAKLQVLFHVSK